MLVVNNRKVHYPGTLQWVKRMAHTLKRSYYTFSEQEICGKKITILHDVIGNPQHLFQPDRFAIADDHFDHVWVKTKYNLVEIAMHFSPETDVREFIQQFKEFVEIMRGFQRDLYGGLEPKRLNGIPVKFWDYLSEEVVRIKDSINDKITGVYGSEYAVAMCFLMFGTRRNFDDFHLYVKQIYGFTFYEAALKPFFSELAKAHFRDE